MKSLSLSQPHAIVMVGIPGSGKTSFAQKFAETFGAPFVQTDLIEDLAQSRESAKKIVELQISELTKTHYSLVLDVDSSTRTERTELVKFLRSHNYRVLFVWVQTDEATARHRNKKKLSNDEYDAQLKRFSAPHESEEAAVVSGKHTYATQARAVLKRLSGERASAAATPVAPPPARSTSIDVRRGN